MLQHARRRLGLIRGRRGAGGLLPPDPAPSWSCGPHSQPPTPCYAPELTRSRPITQSSPGRDPRLQADYAIKLTKEIVAHGSDAKHCDKARRGDEKCSSIGGFLMSWVDEFWKGARHTARNRHTARDLPMIQPVDLSIIQRSHVRGCPHSSAHTCVPRRVQAPSRRPRALRRTTTRTSRPRGAGRRRTSPAATGTRASTTFAATNSTPRRTGT